MNFKSSLKTTEYELNDELKGVIIIEKRNSTVMLEAYIRDATGQSDEEVLVYKGFNGDYNAAPLFGRAYEILRDTDQCIKFWNDHITNIKEEKEND